MTLGVIILAHTALNRTAEVTRYWAENGVRVMIHIDRKVTAKDYDALVARLSDLGGVHFAPRHDCTWGNWSLVQATIDSAEALLAAEPEVSHVLLTSGTCIPVRPVPALIAFLAQHRNSDFIESVTTEDVPWAVSGLEEERFTLYFPFSWKRHRKLFDHAVSLQRLLRIKRHIPAGIVPHLGSQWWCLTRNTLEAILADPARPTFERYFRHVWIPDESYFQTLVRRHSKAIESRSLTFAKFDAQGRPHTFYDDHQNLLAHSGYFIARKIWPLADRLYAHFLSRRARTTRQIEASPTNVDQVLTKAAGRRQTGRPGLYMQSRFPSRSRLLQKTAAPYLVVEGFDALFQGFDKWFTPATGARLHGHLFAPDRVAFADGAEIFAGSLTDSAILRDYDPAAFMCNLIWNTRGETQALKFGPDDVQKITDFWAWDSNARIAIVTGAWAVTLLHADLPFAEKRKRAALLQKIEAKHLAILQSADTRARVWTITLEAALRDPARVLVGLLEHCRSRAVVTPRVIPELMPIDGITNFLQDLKNDGLRLHLVGNVREIPGDPGTLQRVGS